MSEISILAIILAKNSFQVCGVRSDGVVVFDGSVSRASARFYAPSPAWGLSRQR